MITLEKAKRPMHEHNLIECYSIATLCQCGITRSNIGVHVFKYFMIDSNNNN